MKLVVRILALSFVVAGAAAAATTTKATPALSNHQSVTDTLPVPGCGPHIPGCDQ